MDRLSFGSRLKFYFGPYEKPITEIYRRIFINLEAFSKELKYRIKADTILEVGCGEGLLTEQLHKIFPTALIIGIDISSRVGRLFSKTPQNVLFLNRTVQSFELEYKKYFDLIVICDVLHHVPTKQIPSLLQSVGQMMKPGGNIVIKEWRKKWNLIHLLGYFSDRWITGDRICYLRIADWEKLFCDIFGHSAIREKFFVPPWSNNIAFQIRPE